MRYRALLVILLLLPFCSTAQKVKLVNSTATNWSGGIAGRSDTNYMFKVEFSGYGKSQPMPDTLWIGNKCIPLILKTNPAPPNFNLISTAGKKKVTYEIMGAVSKDLNKNRPDPYQEANKKNHLPLPPVKCSGVALLSYHHNGRRYFYTIEKVLTQNPPLNYP